MNTRREKRAAGRSWRRTAGMTLMEVVISLAIAGMAIGGIISGYTFCATSADKTGLFLAANARAMEGLERTRSAQWVTSWPQVDQVVATNFPNKVVTLDLAGSGAGVRTATIQTTISQISTDPPLKRVRVDCIWTYKGRSITNTIETCRAPDS